MTLLCAVFAAVVSTAEGVFRYPQEQYRFSQWHRSSRGR